MGKISVSDILSDFQIMWKEKWSYSSDIKRGQVDCSGAFVWSYQQHGCSIYHGSNRIARTEVVKLIPIKQAKIVPGMAAFKAKEPPFIFNTNGYSLPDSYKKGGSYYNGDLNDYYHIGLVSEDSKSVYNAQNLQNGFVKSDISNGWTHVAYLKQVEYNKVSVKNPEIVVKNETVDSSSKLSGIVIASSGQFVKMRKTPSKNQSVYWNVPVKAQVDILEEPSNGWAKIRYEGREGYMMEEFLDIANG